MKTEDVLPYILARLGNSKSGLAYFDADEVSEWPAGSLEALENIGVLASADPALELECRGCTEQCIKPVEFLDASTPVIACDVRADTGFLNIDPGRRRRWQISVERMAQTIGSLLEIRTSPVQLASPTIWMVGVLRSRKRSADVLLTLCDGVVVLRIGGQQLVLANVLTFEPGSLEIEREELVYLVDHPPKQREPTGLTKREERKLATQKRREGWQAECDRLVDGHPGMSKGWYAKRIERSPAAQGESSETIRKNIRLKKFGRKNIAQSQRMPSR